MEGKPIANGSNQSLLNRRCRSLGWKVDSETYKNEWVIDVHCFHSFVQRHKHRRIYNTTDGLACHPFPRLVSISENDAVRDFNRLPVFVWLEKCAACSQCSDQMHGHKQTKDHGSPVVETPHTYLRTLILPNRVQTP